MSLLEAANAVGRGVVYHPQSGRAEDGVITGVNAKWVFVRYGTQKWAKATAPEDLELLTYEPQEEMP